MAAAPCENILCVFPQPQAHQYYDGLNEALFDSVPDEALRIIEFGCSRGNLGAALKQAATDRYVIGVEIDEAAAAVARERLDEVHVLDIQSTLPPIEPGSVDAILFGDVLEHLVDPEDVLRRVRPLLSPRGIVLASIPNMSHWSVVSALLRSDLMYQPQGLLDATHLRFFTHATIFKLFLDAGYLPDRQRVVAKPLSDQFMHDATPLLQHLRMDPHRGRSLLEAFQYVISGRPLPEVSEEFATVPITFVACVNDEAQLNSNLLRSPCLAPGTPHEVILQREQSNAAQGLNEGLARAQHALVVFVHQDMYLPRGWDTRFTRSWTQAAEQFAPLGVAGLFGLTYGNGAPEHIGQVVDRVHLRDQPTPLPARVDGLDEIILAVPRDTPLRLDERLGFHSYGADLCLSARQLGLATVVLRAPAYHNSLFARPDAGFHASREALLHKWTEPRPLFSNMGRLDTMTSVLPPPAPAMIPTIEHQKAVERRDREIASLREQLAASRSRVSRMEGSAFWKLRTRVRRIVPHK